MEDKKKKNEGEADIPGQEEASELRCNSNTVTEKENTADAKDLKIANLEKEITELKDKQLRTLADFENFKKRTYKDILDAKLNSKIDSVFPFLNVYGHFQLAVKAADEKHSFEVLHKGMEMILSEFSKAFEENGIEKIEALGQKFDPLLHQAADQKSSDDVAEGNVIEQWRCGYRIGEKVIQPALVVVSSGASKEKKTDSKESKEDEKSSSSGEPLI
ncbi:MAG TPA: nucleotide exchange factor GrpE [Victivallales bacterium]|nr:nucleotide exchange factor GrpE [Victivallales bacterium]